MGPSSPSQEGLFTDLRLLSLEKQLNIELKVHVVEEKETNEKKCVTCSMKIEIDRLEKKFFSSQLKLCSESQFFDVFKYRTASINYSVDKIALKNVKVVRLILMSPQCL